MAEGTRNPYLLLAKGSWIPPLGLSHWGKRCCLQDSLLECKIPHSLESASNTSTHTPLSDGIPLACSSPKISAGRRHAYPNSQTPHPVVLVFIFQPGGLGECIQVVMCKEV